MELQAGMPAKKGNKRGPAYDYNEKELREGETEVARQAERAYEHFVSQWQTRRPSARRTGAARRSDDSGCAAELASSSSALRYAVPVPDKDTRPACEGLSISSVVRIDFHWSLGSAGVRVVRFRGGGDRAAAQAPFAQERPALSIHLGDCLGVDHVGVIGADLVVERLRRMGQQVAVLCTVQRWSGTSFQMAEMAFSKPTRRRR